MADIIIIKLPEMNTYSLIRFMPRHFRAKIENWPNSTNILDNVGWLFFDKILRAGVELLVIAWVARYLGPRQFGLLNFATAFVVLFGAISGLGLRGIVVRDIVNKPEQKYKTLGTSFGLQVIGGLLAFLLIIYLISYLRPDDVLTKYIVAILGFTHIFKATEVIKYWFESQVTSKFTVWVENGVLLAIASIKVIMILSGSSIMAFVWAAFAEAALVALLLMVMYILKVAAITSWRPNISKGKELILDSWPLIMSGIAVVIYMKIDNIMLGQMIGDEAVGIYSVASRISEAWYFVPMAIISSLFPSLIEAKKQSGKAYYQRLQKVYDLMVLLGVAVALPMTFFSTEVISLFFGESYIPAGPILSVHVWATLFVCLGAASSNWFLIENRQMLSFQRTALGAAVNVGLNFLLIKKYGTIGAAYSTLVSYGFAGFIYDCLQKETRGMFIMKINSFNLLRVIKNLIG
ncbi:MAG: flippase [Anaerolineaceae bacterium]